MKFLLLSVFISLLLPLPGFSSSKIDSKKDPYAAIPAPNTTFKGSTYTVLLMPKTPILDDLRYDERSALERISKQKLLIFLSNRRLLRETAKQNPEVKPDPKERIDNAAFDQVVMVNKAESRQKQYRKGKKKKDDGRSRQFFGIELKKKNDNRRG